MKKQFVILLVMLSAVQIAFSYEMREWEVNGKMVRGRFERELFGKLTIVDEEGNETRFEVAELSDKDKKYVRVMIPPEIEVVARTKDRQLPRRPMALYRDDIEKVHSVTATISKKSQRPFTSRLNIEIFLIAEEVDGDNYILLARFDDDFLLLDEKDHQYIYQSKPVQTTQFTDIGSDDRKGELFKGYVLIITSMQGDVLVTQSNLPSWMQEPKFLDKMRELSIRGAPSVRSRHFDKSGNKVAPQRPSNCPLKTT
jgi:hypothetical protein